MKHMLSILLLGLALLVAMPTAAAQIGTKAYAPEDLRDLSQNDQVRVISLEYSEQSRGRRIPDDQLRFYLDQVNRSSWTFSRIKQDIATSLGGRPGGWNPAPPPLPGPAGSVTCESDNNRYRECPTGFRGRAVLVQNISQTRCIEGQNWGSADGVVWVDRGCKGRFDRAPGAGGSGAVVRCESRSNRRQDCNTGFRSDAVLSRQLSSTRCIEGQTWGQRRGSVWVSGGCRAEFTEVTGGWGPGPGAGNGNYSVTCSSTNNRRSTCAWNNRQGRPVLIQQLSSDACQEGYSWGYLGTTIWVDRGCRARFGSSR